MTEQHPLTDTAAALTALHVPGDPLVLVNVWDAGSARVVDSAGARALATGSWSVAAALGEEDGERLGREDLLAVLRRVCAATRLPVSVDLEGGYGAEPSDVAESTAAVVAAGAVGCNLEDGVAGARLRPVPEAAERVRAAVAGAASAGLDGFHVNARTDVFLARPAAEHAAGVAEALERAAAYAEAGARSFFVPGLTDPELVARVVQESPLPVNVMVLTDETDHARLAELGVARISHGPGPYQAATERLDAYARRALA